MLQWRPMPRPPSDLVLSAEHERIWQNYTNKDQLEWLSKFRLAAVNLPWGVSGMA